MNGMHTDRHHVGLSSCLKALSNGRYGSSLIGFNACQNERLLQQGILCPVLCPALHYALYYALHL
eukprot:527429-Pelagomonas_calceolata.AAC.1